jgi:hypothetical protein
MLPEQCHYHPGARIAGECIECHGDFCDECAVEIVRHGAVCLDCGAAFARKKLTQAYIAAGLGLLVGIVIATSAASRSDWGFAILAPFIYLYFFPAAFFGWHYGGKIWTTLSSATDHFSGFAGLSATIFFLVFRLMVAVFLGVFGGGILQYLNYRRIVESQRALSQPSPLQSAA